MSFPDPRTRIQTLVERAEQAMLEENWQVATKNWRTAIKRMRKQAPPKFFIKLSFCYRKQTLLKKATRTIEQALGLHPSNPSIHIEYAEIAMQEQDWSVAITRWEDVRQRFNDNMAPAVWLRLCRALRQNNELEKAQKIITIAWDAYPGNTDLLVERAEVETTQKNWKVALRLWQQVLSSHTRSEGSVLRARLCISVLKRLVDPKSYQDTIVDYQKYIKRLSQSGHRIAIVTSFTEGYDDLKPHEFIDKRFDYFAYTDFIPNGFGLYDIRPLPVTNLDSPRNIRYIKTHPHTLFRSYDLVVWLDASIMIVGDLFPLLGKFMNSGYPIGANKHPLRTSVYEEIQACIDLKKDNPKDLKRQMTFYKKKGFSGKNLAECGFLTFNLKDHAEEVMLAMDTWWDQLTTFSRRDQLSFPYALESHNIKWYTLTQPPHGVRNHPDILLTPHGPENKIIEELATVLRARES